MSCSLDREKQVHKGSRGSRVLVTGATGVIGCRVIPLLIRAGHDVTAVGRTHEKRLWLRRRGARGIDVDLFDSGSVQQATAGMEVIINLATAVPAAGPGMLLPWAWREMDRIRRQASANLVSSALAGGTVHRYVQESFAPIYGDGGAAWLCESAPVEPARYNRSVLDAEGQTGRFTKAGGAGVVLRFGAFYGPEDVPTQQLLDAVARGWYPLPGDPGAFWSWISHEDAAAAVVAAFDVPAGIYNVVEGEPLTRREQADGIAKLLGSRQPRLMPGWTGRLAGSLGGTLSRSLRISNRKLRRASDWTPRYDSLIEGLAHVLTATPNARAKWGRNHRDRLHGTQTICSGSETRA